LRAIQAQMNPHFIFNVLNRLVEMISSAKLIQAERFVIDFAKLLRNILEQSEKDFISIREELKTLQIYLEIQRTRRRESFQYQILSDEELDSHQIPTMLIQPFIENAIVHGVDHAEYLTQINLLFYLEEGDLHIKIQDNGIGREQASKINQNRKNESKGIGLIRRKIELLRKKYQIDIVLMIHDWKEAPPVGTEVHLIIKHARI
ncbi:MAG: sensor histidine kinase, partial [Chitinophagales bacterium]